MGRVTVKKSDPGIAWGSVHWQYLEDVSKVPTASAGPLKVSKSLYRRQSTKAGAVLEPIRGPIRAGDEVIVRLRAPNRSRNGVCPSQGPAPQRR